MSQSKIILLLTLFTLPSTGVGQRRISPKDSIEVKNHIEGFYLWYIDMSKEGRLREDFNPSFIRRDDGSTTLDFTKYANGLRKHRFTEDFIQFKINGYKGCAEYLNKILWVKFSQMKDLDELESINCDLGNKYEWTGGMEPKDKAELTSLKLMDKKTIIGRVGFTAYSNPDGTAIVTFRKFKRDWKIYNLVLE